MNSEFAQGETMVTVFSGNFYDQITNNNVHFYSNAETSVEIPIISGVVRINNDFYVYALLANKAPGNYSISVEGVRYYTATGAITDNDIVSDFIISSETAAFSVNPGALFTAAGFSVEIQNRQDSRITIGIDKDSSLINSVSAVELNTGEKKTVSFSLDEQAARGLTTIVFSSGNTTYSMPVYLDTTNEEQGTDDIPEEGFSMQFQPKTAEIFMATDSDTKRIIYLKNTGTATIENIFFNVSSLLEPYVAVVSKKISSLSPGEIKQVEIEISSGSGEAILEGRITAYAEDVSTQFTLILNLTKDFVPAEQETGENLNILSLCEDLGGVICGEDLECSGEIKRTKNGDCCIQPFVCQEPKKSSSKKIIGWGLLILVFIIIIWFFKRKYKRVSPRRPF